MNKVVEMIWSIHSWYMKLFSILDLTFLNDQVWHTSDSTCVYCTNKATFIIVWWKKANGNCQKRNNFSHSSWYFFLVVMVVRVQVNCTDFKILLAAFMMFIEISHVPFTLPYFWRSVAPVFESLQWNMKWTLRVTFAFFQSSLSSLELDRRHVWTKMKWFIIWVRGIS
jgi:hypothetical protein